MAMYEMAGEDEPFLPELHDFMIIEISQGRYNNVTGLLDLWLYSTKLLIVYVRGGGKSLTRRKLMSEIFSQAEHWPYSWA